MAERLYIIGMDGLGDNIYQRPLVRMSAAKFNLWLRTPWPELYQDINVKCVPTPTNLRTQQKNQGLQPSTVWSAPPAHHHRVLQIRYGQAELASASIVKALESKWPGADGTYRMDLPDFGRSPITEMAPIAIVRPATLRKEWLAPARNPRPEYIQEAIDILNQRGFYVVSIADCDGHQEWFDGPEPHGMDLKFHSGELTYRPLMALVQHCALVVGGVGWIVPAAIAANRALFVIFGGRGAHNGPDVIFDPRMDTSRANWALPKNFCRCTEANHACDKHIDDFAARFTEWLAKLDLAASTRFGILPDQSVNANLR